MGRLGALFVAAPFLLACTADERRKVTHDNQGMKRPVTRHLRCVDGHDHVLVDTTDIGDYRYDSDGTFWSWDSIDFTQSTKITLLEGSCVYTEVVEPGVARVEDLVQELEMEQ
jgi:hypothetical protein